jgi:mono/diheme cytochrome c family protein
MIAGHMPAVDASPADMSALLAYLAVLGTSAANVPASHGVVTPEPQSRHGQPGSNALEAPAASESTSAPNTTDAGRQIFEQHGCAACHGPSGTGGRAPSIPSLIGKHSDAELLEALKVPNAKMKAGGMQPVTGTPVELSSLVAYLRTLNASPPARQPTNEAVNTSPTTTAAPSATGAPPAPAPATVAAAPGPGVNPGRAVFVSQGCAACHGANAGGTHFAPSLIGISAKFPGDALTTLLHHPNAKMRSGGMPPVTANPAEMKQLIAYLSSLNVSGAASPGVAGARAAGTAAPSTAASSHAVVAVPLSPLAVRGQQIFQHYSCQTCHGAGGLYGTVAAPGLAGTASVLPAATLENLLRHHSTQMKKGNMPPTNMKASDMNALIAYIRSMPSPPDTQ